MQYLLNQDEYDALRFPIEPDPAEVDEGARAALIIVCQLAAAHIPVGKAGEPWGCIHVQKSTLFCDDCPVRGLCPQEKRWSTTHGIASL